MSDTSTQLAKFISKKPVTVGKNNTPAVEVNYTRIDGEVPKDMTVRYLVGRLPEASKSVLQALSIGETFVVIKQKEGEHWNLKEFKTADTFVAPPPKAPWTGGSKSTTTSSSSTYDTTGVKVGAARNQAIAYLAATKGTKFTLDDVDTTAYEIVKRQATQEDNVRKGVTTTTKTTDTEENYTNDTFDSVPF